MCAAKGRVLPAREEANRFVGGMCRAPFLSVLGAQRLCIQKSDVERFVASIPRPVSTVSVCFVTWFTARGVYIMVSRGTRNVVTMMSLTC